MRKQRKALPILCSKPVSVLDKSSADTIIRLEKENSDKTTDTLGIPLDTSKTTLVLENSKACDTEKYLYQKDSVKTDALEKLRSLTIENLESQRLQHMDKYYKSLSQLVDLTEQNDQLRIEFNVCINYSIIY